MPAMTRSARMRAMALLTVSSMRCRGTSTPSASRVNQATCRPASAPSGPGLGGRPRASGRRSCRCCVADHHVLPAPDSFQGLRGTAWVRGRDGGQGLAPGVEGLTGGDGGGPPGGSPAWSSPGQRVPRPAVAESADFIGSCGHPDLDPVSSSRPSRSGLPADRFS
jgi:hypothetical protein